MGSTAAGQGRGMTDIFAGPSTELMADTPNMECDEVCICYDVMKAAIENSPFNNRYLEMAAGYEQFYPEMVKTDIPGEYAGYILPAEAPGIFRDLIIERENQTASLVEI